MLKGTVQSFAADEIEKLMKILKTSKACGLDNISREFLKNVGGKLAIYLE